MMGNLPFRVNDWAFPDFYDAVAGAESDGPSSLNQVQMRPLITVSVNVIADLAKQDPLRLQDAICFPYERGVGMGETIAVLLGGTDRQAKAAIEILGPVLALIWYVGGIVDDHVEEGGAKRHVAIVANDLRPVSLINVETNNLPLAPAPKPTDVDGGIQHPTWPFSWVECQHVLHELRIITKPY
jgi:hypothetical protein